MFQDISLGMGQIVKLAYGKWQPEEQIDGVDIRLVTEKLLGIYIWPRMRWILQ